MKVSVKELEKYLDSKIEEAVDEGSKTSSEDTRAMCAGASLALSRIKIALTNGTIKGEEQ